MFSSLDCINQRLEEINVRLNCAERAGGKSDTQAATSARCVILETAKRFFILCIFLVITSLCILEEVDEETRKLITRLYRRCNARRQYWVNNTSLHNDTTWCPVIFDGYENYANKFNRQVNKVNRSSYLCWGPTKADTTEIRTCPNYVIGYDERLTASKVCLPNGTWWRQPGKDDSWSNYTTCIDHRDYEVN